MKRFIMAIALVFGVMTISGMHSPVSAGSVSNCTVIASNVQKSTIDVDGQPFSLRGNGMFACPYYSQFKMTVELRRHQPLYFDDSLVTEVWTPIFTYVPNKTMSGYVAKKGCVTGGGDYFSKVTLTDEATGATKTVTSPSIYLFIDCS